MKAITIKHPWASLISLGMKSIETRSWATKYRGPLAIHASARLGDSESRAICLQEPFRSVLLEAELLIPAGRGCWKHNFPLGMGIATCNLVDCLEIGESGLYREIKTKVSLIDNFMETLVRVASLPDEPERSFGDYTPSRFAWILEDVKQIEPVPAKGHLGLWNWEG